MRRRSVGAFSGEEPETVERVVNRVISDEALGRRVASSVRETFEAAYFEELQ